jgi:hypothetical protein
MLNKEQILSAVDLKVQEVEVPEWGGAVLVQALGSADYEEVKEITRGGKNLRGQIMVRCIVDEKRNPLFILEEAEALGGKNYDVLDRLTDVVLELSGLGEYAGEELEKN